MDQERHKSRYISQIAGISAIPPLTWNGALVILRRTFFDYDSGFDH